MSLCFLRCCDRVVNNINIINLMRLIKALAKSVSISCNPDLLNKLSEYCSERGCSRSWFINKAIEHYMAELEELEDREDYEEGEAA